MLEIPQLTKNINYPFSDLSLPLLKVLINESSVTCRIDHAEWKKFPYTPEVEVKIAYTRKSLLFHFTVSEKQVIAVSTELNSRVYRDSCVECFISPSPESSGSVMFYNFEFNCIGAFLAGKKQLPGDNILYKIEKVKELKVFTSLPAKIPINEKNQSWELVSIIPAELFGMSELTAGTSFTLNMQKCADGADEPHYTSWAPIKTENPDFHQPAFFKSALLK